jgi:predicted metal-dependent phosphotriesterase family hydrolase
MDVMTVRGPVAASSLGVTLPHEHLLADIFLGFQPHREFLLNEIEPAVSELTQYADAGGRTLVELTNIGIGRDPVGLREISERTGVNIVMATGMYREPFYDPAVWKRTTNDLADEFERDINSGVDGGIRAGIIGEIGVHERHISPVEERVHRAAARAQLRTGVAISTHSMASPIGLAQLDLFEDEGVDLRRVVIGHADTYPRPDYHRALLARGAWVEFDTIHGLSDFETQRHASMLKQLIDEGHLDRLLVSHDVSKTTHWTLYGGTGYTYVTTAFATVLETIGVSREQIETLLVENPRRMLTGED